MFCFVAPSEGTLADTHTRLRRKNRAAKGMRVSQPKSFPGSLSLAPGVPSQMAGVGEGWGARRRPGSSGPGHFPAALSLAFISWESCRVTQLGQAERPPPPVRTKTDPVSSARASLLSFPCPRGGRWREPEVDLRPTGTPASSLGSRQFFPRRSKRDGRPGRLLRIDPTESATFPPQTVRSSPRQTAAPVETSGKPSELGAEPDCRDRVDPASFP